MRTRLKRVTHHILFAFALVGVSQQGLAATVKSARGTKVVLILAPDEVRKVGEELTSTDRVHDHHARMVVTSVAGHEVLADLQHGEVEIGDIALPGADIIDEPAGKESESAPEPEPPPEPIQQEEPEPPPKEEPPAKVEVPKAEPKPAKIKMPPKPPDLPPLPPMTISILAGFSMDYQNVTLTSAANVALSGQAFSLRASAANRFYRFRQFAWEGGIGFDQVNTSGTLSTGACNGFDSTATNCTYQTTALSPFGRVGYMLPFFSSFQPQIRVGTDFLFPVSLQSNVVDQGTYHPLFFATGGLSMRLRIGPGAVVPLGFDYAYYVGNSGVTMHRLLFYTGYSWQ